jgi:signal transduction histidine kinase/CheY-like chemotaxis protein
MVNELVVGKFVAKDIREQLKFKHHPVRLRAFFTFSVAAILIICLALGIGGVFVSQSLQSTIQSDFQILVGIADKLVSDEIDILKKDADFIAQRLKLSPSEQRQAILNEELLRLDNNFLALTILNRESIVMAVGDYPTSAGLLSAPYLQHAFSGETVMSTTRVENDGALTMHVCSPIDKDTILSATIDGMYFQKLLGDFTVWVTGDLFLLDETGTMLACGSNDWIKNRYNFIEIAKIDPEFASRAKTTQQMISENEGMSTFKVGSEENILAFRKVSRSTVGWTVGASAPLNEGPMQIVLGGVIVIGLICLVCSLIGAIITAKNVEKPYLEAERNKQEAINANETKSAFLANMSHEMRTPLNAIIGLTELMLSTEELSATVRANAEKVYSSGITLLGLVNDILDLSKVQAGKLEIIPVDYDTPSIINDTVVLNMVRIGSKPIEFKLNINENLPSRLYGDDLRVKQVFNNLLSNAFKYTKEGVVELSVSCERDKLDSQTLWLTASIADTGIGIKPEHMSKLFSDYSQVDTKSNRKVEGTGLGLSLTKRLVELMDGTVTAKSTYGIGSIFTVRFKQGFVTDVPIGKEITEKLTQIQYSDSKRDRSSKLVRAHIPYARVLVVDDVSTNLDVAKGLMRPYGMQIDTVMSAAQAIAAIRSEMPTYNAIFMDHMMPEMDGIEATQIIRNEINTEYARNIPIIALTANAIVGNEQMFLDHGFQAFLSKPIDIMLLDSIINQFVRNRKLEHELAKQEVALGKNQPTAIERRSNSDRRQSERRSGKDRRENVSAAIMPDAAFLNNEQITQHDLLNHWCIHDIDLKHGLKLFGDDATTYWEVIESYVKNTRKILHDLNHYLTEDKMSEYGIAIHGVKGSSRAIAAETLGTHAEELEHAAKSDNSVFVSEHHKEFVKKTTVLLDALQKMLDSYKDTTKEQALEVKERPDIDILKRLYEAALNFDIDATDIAMEELDAYRYSNDDGLSTWLHEQVAVAGFKKIAKRLEEFIKANDHRSDDAIREALKSTNGAASGVVKGIE